MFNLAKLVQLVATYVFKEGFACESIVFLKFQPLKVNLLARLAVLPIVSALEQVHYSFIKLSNLFSVVLRN